MASLLNLGMAPAAIEAALNNLVVGSAILDIQNLYLQFVSFFNLFFNATQSIRTMKITYHGMFFHFLQS